MKEKKDSENEESQKIAGVAQANNRGLSNSVHGGPPDQNRQTYYVEFNIKQQRNFENCIIENQIVVTPERLVCLSDIRIKDMRKFVYY